MRITVTASLRSPSCHERAARLRARSDRTLVRLVHAPNRFRVAAAEQRRIREASECRAGDWSEPKQPQLSERPTANEYRRPCAARGIYRNVGDRDPDQMNER